MNKVKWQFLLTVLITLLFSLFLKYLFTVNLNIWIQVLTSFEFFLLFILPWAFFFIVYLSFIEEQTKNEDISIIFMISIILISVSLFIVIWNYIEDKQDNFLKMENKQIIIWKDETWNYFHKSWNFLLKTNWELNVNDAYKNLLCLKTWVQHKIEDFKMKVSNCKEIYNWEFSSKNFIDLFDWKQDEIYKIEVIEVVSWKTFHWTVQVNKENSN